MKPIYLSLLFLLVFNNFSLAQAIFPSPNEQHKLTIRAEPATQKIVLDGSLSEEDWQRCQSVSGFVQSMPNQGKKATYGTEVKILYDKQFIYIGAVCYNPGGKVLVQDLRRDFIYGNNDLFGVFIDPFRDVQSPVQSFLVTPLGTQRDLLIYDDRIYDLNWDAVWDAKCRVTDSTWSVEMAIPWSTLRYPEGATTWSINFNRNIRKFNEVTGWSPWPLAYTVGRMAYAGLVTNLHPPENHGSLQLNPYVLGNASKSKGYAGSNTAHFGGEVKWLVSTNTSLEATFNTDFAQADADKQVINLSRSSVFFPEKRQFFLENANLFSVGQDGIIQPFFSRRIGLSDNGAPLTIDGGVRLIHQDSKGAFGAMFIRQTDPDTCSGSWFGVIRGQKNFSDKARLGALVTYRYDDIHGMSNAVAAVDGYWRISQPLFIRPMVSVTLPSAGSKGGMAYFTEVSYIKNTMNFNLLETYVSKDYDPRTGFLGRTNFVNTQPTFWLTQPVNWLNGHVRYFAPFIGADIYHDAATLGWEEANLNIVPFQLIFKNGTIFWLALQPSWQNLKSDYTIVPGLTVAPAIYRYARFDMNVSTDLSKAWSLFADISTGGFYNGKLTSYNLIARLVPVPNIATDINYIYDDFYGFSAVSHHLTTHLVGPEVRLSFTSKIQLSSFYQYNTDSKQAALNARFSWEFKPLSFVYLVFNDLRSINTLLPSDAFHQQAGILKISYILQL